MINNYLGRVGLINSGGASKGTTESDLQDALFTAIVNKRAGGTGLITGRKSFQKSMDEGIKFLNCIQDVYLSDQISLA